MEDDRRVEVAAQKGMEDDRGAERGEFDRQQGSRRTAERTGLSLTDSRGGE